MRRPGEAPRVQQIRLDNAEFEGQNNAYLFDRGDGPVTLVDTGIADETVRDTLREALAAQGVGFADVERVLLTHYHYDHAGLAGEIQATGETEVYAHPADVPLLGGGQRQRIAFRDVFETGIAGWGMPAEARTALEAFLEGHADLAGEPIDATPLQPGRSYAAGDTALTPVHLPGHTRGHVGYQLPDGSLLAGDALLPVYTPNIGGADLRVERPLATYLSTLRELVRRDPPTAWPGHRDRIDEPAARARAIRDHHRDRTRRVIEILARDGPMDTWGVSAALFGDLVGIHILHGPGEASAHLRHLEDAGVVARSDGAYRLVDAEADADALVPRVD